MDNLDDKFKNDDFIIKNSDSSYGFEDDSLKPKEKTSKPLIAGILLILSGLIAILFWGSIVMSIDYIIETIDITQIEGMYPEFDIEDVKQGLQICGSIGIILSVFPILGGIFSIQRKLWGIALVGGIFGLFTLGFIVVSPVMSLIGIILIFISKDEF